MITRGNNDVKAIYRGNTPVTAVYNGNVKIWPGAFSHYYIEIENVPGVVHKYAVRKFGEDWFMVDYLCEDYDDGGVRVYETETAMFENYSSDLTRFLNVYNFGYPTCNRIYSGFCMNYDYYNSGRRLFPAWLSVPTTSDITNLESLLGTTSGNWMKPDGFNFYSVGGSYSGKDGDYWIQGSRGANVFASIWVNRTGLPTGSGSENVIYFYGLSSNYKNFAYIAMQVGRGMGLRLKVADESRVKYSEAYVPRPDWNGS
jgi:hypothetical protein